MLHTYPIPPTTEETINATPEEIENTWLSLVELIVEAMKECLQNERIPGKGLNGVEDSLNETLIRDKKKG